MTGAGPTEREQAIIDSLPDMTLIDKRELARLRAVEAAHDRTREYVQNNLDVWVDGHDDVSVALADVYQKVLNVIDTGHPMRAALATSRSDLTDEPATECTDLCWGDWHYHGTKPASEG